MDGGRRCAARVSGDLRGTRRRTRPGREALLYRAMVGVSSAVLAAIKSSRRRSRFAEHHLYIGGGDRRFFLALAISRRTVLGALTVLVMMLPMAAAPPAFGASTDRLAEAMRPDNPAFQAAEAAGQRREQARRQHRDSAAGKREREDSRASYRDKSSTEAVGTARKKFGDYLDAPAFPWPALGSGQVLERFVGDQAAVVKYPSGKRGLVQGSVPLRGQTPDGTKAPIDLRLSDQGTAFAPRSALGAMRLPKRSSDGLRLATLGVNIRVVGDRGQAAQVIRDKAFYANVLPDSDLILRPLPGGSELSVLLRSPASPHAVTLAFDLPSGGSLRYAGPLDMTPPAPPGSVDVMEGGRRIAVVSPAEAVDAQGQPVPVRYELKGDDQLIMHVGDTSNVTWPVMIDPTTAIYDLYGQASSTSWPGWGFTSAQGDAFAPSIYGNALYISEYNAYYTAGHYAYWFRTAAPDSYIYRVDEANTSNSGYGEELFGGLCCETAAPYTGFYNFGYWFTPTDSTQQGGGYAERIDPSYDQGVTTYYCGHSCTPGTDIPTGNFAALGMEATYSFNPYPAIPQVAMGTAATFSSDNYPPNISFTSHTGTGWLKTGSTDTVTLATSDRGLGLGQATVTGPGVPTATASAPCDGHYNSCPLSWNPQVTYSVTDSTPEGSNTITGNATDIVGNQTGDSAHPPATWGIRVDHTPPAISFSDTLFDNNIDPNDPTHPTLDEDAYNLHISASDSLSGVASADVTVDNQNPPDGAAHFVPTSCSGDGCSLDANWTFNTPVYEDGVHEIEVTARDNAGNSSAPQTFYVDVEGAEAKPGQPDTSADDSPTAGTGSSDRSVYCNSSTTECASAIAGNAYTTAVAAEQPLDKNVSPLFVGADSTQGTFGPQLPARRYGFDDQSPMVSTTRRPNVYGDSAYQSLNIMRVRLVVPYDLVPAGANSGDHASVNRLQHVRSWYHNTLVSGREPLVSFEHSKVNRKHKPADSEYIQDTTQFLQMFPAVALYTAWNEPNNPNSQPTASDPAQTARYYNDLLHECNSFVNNGNGCVVAAGDFLDTHFGSYDINTYKANLVSPPRVWAWHPYTDGKHHTTSRLDYFLKVSYNSAISSVVWITEAAGVDHQSQTGYPSSYDQENTGADDSDYLMGTLANYFRSDQGRRIVRFYYAGYFEDRKFDTGLIRKPSNPLYGSRGRVRQNAYDTVQSYTAG